MSRVFVPITVDELKKKIESFSMEVYGNYKFITPQVEKDLKKVKFDTGNITSESYKFGAKDMLGYNTFPNGMPYLGVCAGGDWEIPVFFCIYWDGKKLRGYIPEKGNMYNITTKQAYGNDNEADLKDLRKRFPYNTHFDVEDYDNAWNCDEMEKDIVERIVKKDTTLAKYSNDKLLDELRRRLKNTNED